jgi:hypothetical protein
LNRQRRIQLERRIDPVELHSAGDSMAIAHSM